MSTPDLAVLVAVGPLDRAKTRLGPALDPAERRELVLAMLDDVLRAIRGAHRGQLLVITPDEGVHPIARAHDAAVLRDRGHGTNAAIVDALASDIARDASTALIVQGDLPQLLPEHIAAIVAALGTLESPAAVLVPNADGGTSALALRPPSAMRTAFGPDSSAHHRDAAAAAAISLHELPIADLARDVDTIEDLERVSPTAGPATSALLERLGLTVR